MKYLKNIALIVTGSFTLLGIESCVENCNGVKRIEFGEVKLEQTSLDFLPKSIPHQHTFINNQGRRTTYTNIKNKVEVHHTGVTLCETYENESLALVTGKKHTIGYKSNDILSDSYYYSISTNMDLLNDGTPIVTDQFALDFRIVLSMRGFKGEEELNSLYDEVGRNIEFHSDITLLGKKFYNVYISDNEEPMYYSAGVGVVAFIKEGNLWVRED